MVRISWDMKILSKLLLFDLIWAMGVNLFCKQHNRVHLKTAM